MAVRFNADGQNYTSTSGTIGPPLTMMCWGMVSVDRNTFSCFIDIDNAGITGTFMLECRNSGTLLGLYSDPHGAWIDGLDMTVGTWYKMAATWTAGATATLYHAVAGSPLASMGSATRTVPGTLPTVTRIGEDVYNSDWLNGRVANVKIYSAVLTADEIERELSQYTPARTADLYRWHPFLAHETAEYSGNARTLTAVGAGAVTEDGPPIPWSAQVVPVVHVVAAGSASPAAGNAAATGAAADATVTVTDAPRPLFRQFAVPRAANF